MLKHPKLTIERLHKADAERLSPLALRERVPAELAVFHVGGDGEPVPVEEAMRAVFTPCAVGERWGHPWGTSWFRMRGKVPAEWAGRRVHVIFSYRAMGTHSHEGFTAEGLAFSNGEPLGAINRNRDDVVVIDSAQGGEDIEVFIEMAANGSDHPLWFGEPGRPVTGVRFDMPMQSEVTAAAFAAWDEEGWQVARDFHVLAHSAHVVPETSPRRDQILVVANRALDLFDEADRGTWAAMRKVMAPELAKTNGSSQHRITAIGHAHIDTAWLWPLRESIRKCARTFSTQLRYAKEYPDFVFGCSQPVHYTWMKAWYPAIWRGIQEAVRRGQWEPLGAMWIEPDCNIPSGESLVRQIVHGKRFFLDEFGVDVRHVWLPDVFGYPATLPQIMKLAGVETFLTQKISWSQFNRFPHHSFYWEGIDGTKIFTHFPPTDTYNGNLDPWELCRGNDRHLDHGRLDRSLYIYGHGDGGGGPTRGMIENARRLRDFDGVPKVEMGQASRFFDTARQEARDLLTWSGELYLEFHRGTFTTQAAVKRENRECERLLFGAEFLDAVDVALGSSAGTRPPIEEPPRALWDTYVRQSADSRFGRVGALDRAWKLLLLNQFHDVIPGSSTAWVYQDAQRNFSVIRKLAGAVAENSFATLGGAIRTTGFASPLLAWNPAPVTRAEVVSMPDASPRWIEIPSAGYNVLENAAAAELPRSVASVVLRRDQDVLTLENGLVRYAINRSGDLILAEDLRAGRPILTPGEVGNRLQLHPDRPNGGEAWDIDAFDIDSGRDLPRAVSVEVSEEGPLRVVVRIVREFGKSRLEQKVILRAGSARLDFVTEVDWQERRALLKAGFPLALRSSRATYEIPFGHVERPTHRNTSWDMAKFEVCGHRWAHLGEPDFGVAVLNDCKYGYDCFGSNLRLSLLRAPHYPDPDADRGSHRFTYSLFPHQGTLQSGGVIEEAWRVNQPVEFRALTPNQRGTLSEAGSLVEVDRPGVFLAAFKVSEDGSNLVLRLYEGHGTRGRAIVRSPLPLANPRLADLLERELPEPDAAGLTVLENGSFGLDFTPFQIRTVLVERRAH